MGFSQLLIRSLHLLKEGRLLLFIFIPYLPIQGLDWLSSPVPELFLPVLKVSFPQIVIFFGFCFSDPQVP